MTFGKSNEMREHIRTVLVAFVVLSLVVTAIAKFGTLFLPSPEYNSIDPIFPILTQYQLLFLATSVELFAAAAIWRLQKQPFVWVFLGAMAFAFLSYHAGLRSTGYDNSCLCFGEPGRWKFSSVQADTVAVGLLICWIISSIIGYLTVSTLSKANTVSCLLFLSSFFVGYQDLIAESVKLGGVSDVATFNGDGKQLDSYHRNFSIVLSEGKWRLDMEFSPGHKLIVQGTATNVVEMLVDPAAQTSWPLPVSVVDSDYPRNSFDYVTIPWYGWGADWLGVKVTNNYPVPSFSSSVSPLSHSCRVTIERTDLMMNPVIRSYRFNVDDSRLSIATEHPYLRKEALSKDQRTDRLRYKNMKRISGVTVAELNLLAETNILGHNVPLLLEYKHYNPFGDVLELDGYKRGKVVAVHRFEVNHITHKVDWIDISFDRQASVSDYRFHDDKLEIDLATYLIPSGGFDFKPSPQALAAYAEKTKAARNGASKRALIRFGVWSIIALAIGVPIFMRLKSNNNNKYETNT